jgi:tetratricopeptide (TPR) repeat protein
LQQLGRSEEAVQEVVAVLQSQQNADDFEKAQKVAYWQRRTGNELANKLYERGDFMGALAVYQALARASETPAWRWPAVYQVGLCFERLNHPERAVEAYKLILAPESAPPGDTKLSESLESVRSMAEWRLAHLDWVEDYGKRLQILMAENPAIQ